MAAEQPAHATDLAGGGGQSRGLHSHEPGGGKDRGCARGLLLFIRV